MTPKQQAELIQRMFNSGVNPYVMAEKQRKWAMAAKKKDVMDPKGAVMTVAEKVKRMKELTDTLSKKTEALKRFSEQLGLTKEGRTMTVQVMGYATTGSVSYQTQLAYTTTEMTEHLTPENRIAALDQIHEIICDYLRKEIAHIYEMIREIGADI